MNASRRLAGLIAPQNRSSFDPLRLTRDLMSSEQPWRLIGAVCFPVALITGLAVGPVAAALTAVYLGWALRSWRHKGARRAQSQRDQDTKQAISLATADLYSGAAAGSVLDKTIAALPCDGSRHRRMTRDRIEVIRGIAERTGAPAARLMELLGEELRAQQRGRAAVAAQTAGSHASARLLAALPLAGIALGEGIGAQPLSFLLYTPYGAACVAAAVTLQGLGLKWAGRIDARACDEWGWSG